MVFRVVPIDEKEQLSFYKMTAFLMSMQHLRSVDAILPREYIL